MPSVMTIEGTRAKLDWRKTGRLGSSAKEHRYSAQSYQQEFSTACNNAAAAIKRGDCQQALIEIIDVAQMRQGYGAHAFAFQRNRRARKEASDQMIDRQRILTRRFARKCVI
jgi:hypothetical protein